MILLTFALLIIGAAVLSYVYDVMKYNEMKRHESKQDTNRKN